MRGDLRPAAVGVVLLLGLVLAGGCGGSQESIEIAPAPPVLTLAVIGDVPYGVHQVESFPVFVDAINAVSDIDVVVHLGDILGGDRCSERYYRQIRRLFGRFADPVVYTPGDNEWTDCDEPRAGSHEPTGRLAALRRIFFSRPGMSLGREPMAVRTQARQQRFRRFPENVIWTDRGVVIATLHVVGSNNGRGPWFQGRETAAQRTARQAEFAGRLAADLAWLDETFREATRKDARAVVLAMHADMFSGRNGSGFARIVRRLTARARAFDGPVLLLNGDSHRYLIDTPLPRAPNVTRMVVQGVTVMEWLRVEIDPGSEEPFNSRRRQVIP